MKEKDQQEDRLAVALSMSHHGALQIQKATGEVVIYSENPFYSDYLPDDERFPQGWSWQQIGSRMIKVGKETVDAHPLDGRGSTKMSAAGAWVRDVHPVF